MLKEEFNSSLFTFWISNLGEHFENPLSKESYFVHSGSCEHGFVARLVLLDPTRGVYSLSSLSKISAGYLFYLVVYEIYTFFC